MVTDLNNKDPKEQLQWVRQRIQELKRKPYKTKIAKQANDEMIRQLEELRKKLESSMPKDE